MLSNKTILFSALVLAVISSACIGSNVKVSQTDGLVFNELKLIPTGLTSKDKELTLVYEIQNLGFFNIEPSKYNSGNFQHIIGLSWYGVPGIKGENQIKTDFLRPIPENKVEGDKIRDSIEFDLSQIPGIKGTPKGTIRNYDFNARLLYYYQTSAFNRFTAISEDERSLQKQRGVYKETKLPSTSTPGPIQIELKTQNPIVYYSDDKEHKADFVFIIKNVGKGLVSNAQPIKTDSQNQIHFEANVDGTPANCDGTKFKLHDNEIVIFCSSSITDPTVAEEHQITAVAKYYYVIDKVVPISIKGI